MAIFYDAFQFLWNIGFSRIISFILTYAIIDFILAKTKIVEDPAVRGIIALAIAFGAAMFDLYSKFILTYVAWFAALVIMMVFAMFAWGAVTGEEGVNKFMEFMRTDSRFGKALLLLIIVMFFMVSARVFSTQLFSASPESLMETSDPTAIAMAVLRSPYISALFVTTFVFIAVVMAVQGIGWNKND
jgi:hypothetical protein